MSSDAMELISKFANAWASLGPSLTSDYDCHLTCREAETLADLFRATGADESADLVISGHASLDDKGEPYWEGEPG